MKGTGSGSHHQKQVEVLIGRTKGITISKAFTSHRGFFKFFQITTSFWCKLHSVKLLMMRSEFVGLNSMTILSIEAETEECY